MNEIKILHEWTVTLDKLVDETTTEQRDGQPVTVTRKIKKPVVTKMALKRPTRRELRQAELFYGKRYNWYINEGFLPSSIMTNKHLNLTGGILSDQQKGRVERLLERQAQIENDLARSLNESKETKDKLKHELTLVKSELVNLYSINQTVFSQTADKRAERDLSDWFAYFLVLIDRNGWHPYYEGDTFEKKEEFMWNLEESNDELYLAAVQKISTYVQFFALGLDTSEKFKAAEEELQKGIKEDETPAEPASAPSVETPPNADNPV
jgi:hypothetical protein